MRLRALGYKTVLCRIRFFTINTNLAGAWISFILWNGTAGRSSSCFSNCQLSCFSPHASSSNRTLALCLARRVGREAPGSLSLLAREEKSRALVAKRKHMQRIRTVSDRRLLSYTSPGVYFQVKEMETPFLRYLGNPLMTVYYWFIRIVVFGEYLIVRLAISGYSFVRKLAS